LKKGERRTEDGRKENGKRRQEAGDRKKIED
jgi:hypothetical protein